MSTASGSLHMTTCFSSAKAVLSLHLPITAHVTSLLLHAEQ